MFLKINENIGENFKSSIEYIIDVKKKYKSITEIANKYNFSKQQIAQTYKSIHNIPSVMMQIARAENINLNYLSNGFDSMFLNNDLLQVQLFTDQNDITLNNLCNTDKQNFFTINTKFYSHYFNKANSSNIIALYDKLDQEIKFLLLENELNPCGIHLINYKNNYKMYCELNPSLSKKKDFFISTNNETVNLKDINNENFYIVAKVLCSLKINTL